MQQAGLGPGAGDPGLGLVLATNFGPLESLEWCWRERLEVGTLDLETYRRGEQGLPPPWGGGRGGGGGLGRGGGGEGGGVRGGRGLLKKKEKRGIGAEVGRADDV